MDDGDGSKHHLLISKQLVDDDQEFQEAEVWEAVHGHDHDHNHFEPRRSNLRMKKSKSSNSFGKGGGAHPHHHHGGQGQPVQSSVPLHTPGWSHKSYSSSSMSGFCNHNGDKEVEADDEDEMIPPHEWIARRLARSQISSSSVCEGAGRTLKGRDLSRVRNAVLAKTGFLEQ